MAIPDLKIKDQTKIDVIRLMREVLGKYNPTDEELEKAFNDAITVGINQFGSFASMSTPTYFSSVNSILTSNPAVINVMREVLGKYNPTDEELEKTFKNGADIVRKQFGI